MGRKKIHFTGTIVKCLQEPLVVIAGGQISDDVHDSSIEVIDFTASKSKCRLNIPGLYF